MKSRNWLVGLTALVAFLVWWFWPRAEVQPGSSRPAETVSPATPSETTPAEGAKSSPTPTPPAVIAGKSVSQDQLREIMNSANQPISFFGKVVDQDNNPIPDVKVTFEIRYMKEVGPVGIGDTFDYPSTATGPDGRFALTGAKGSVMGVKSLEKAGYDSSEKSLRRFFWYWRDQNPYRPDSEDPVIFHMWKMAGAERLVKQQKMTRIPYDGTPVIFDLLSGNRVGAGGDLRVTLLRNPLQITYGQKNYEWTLTLEAVDGGIVESNDEQMFRAPADGYQSQVVLHMPADARGWSDKKNIAVFVKSRNGKCYGSVNLDIMVGSEKPTTGLTFRSFVNPSGSRNLEYDPLQNVGKP